jgi:hypothetical protein
MTARNRTLSQLRLGESSRVCMLIIWRLIAEMLVGESSLPSKTSWNTSSIMDSHSLGRPYIALGDDEGESGVCDPCFCHVVHLFRNIGLRVFP